MRLLLDTHTVIWSLIAKHRLPRRAQMAIEYAGSTVYVSAVTAVEVTTKFRIGKLPEAAPFVERYNEMLGALGFEELPLTTAHAHRAGLMPIPHKDPFDRMLIAQALVENLTFVSNEAQFDNYGIIRLWD